MTEITPIERKGIAFTPFDTGLTAFAVVAAIHHKSVDVEKLRRDILEPGTVSSAPDILLAAKREGFRARRIRAKLSRLAKLPLPAIAETKQGSFFVLAKSGAKSVLVLEVGRPPAEWSLEDFAERWNGRLILLAQRDTLAGHISKFGLNWFLPVLGRFKGLLAEVLLVSLAIQLIALITPLIFQAVIDKVLVHKGFSTLDVLAIALLISSVFDALLGWLRTYTFAHTTSRVDAILGAKLFRHLLALPLSYFETRPAGQTVARVRELENIRQFITSSALTLVLDLSFAVLFLVVMWGLSPTLTEIVLVSIPVYAILSVLITPLLRSKIDERFRRGAQNQSMLVESLAGIETLKAMALEPQSRMRWERQMAGYIKTSFEAVRLGAAGSQAVQFVSKAVTAATLWYGAHAVIDNLMTVGSLVAFNMLSGQVNQPIIRIAQMWQDFQQFRLSLDRLGDIINTPTETEASSTRQDLPPIAGDVRFDDILFRYRTGGPEILKRVSLDICAGQVVGIVGRSGSGKSTLAKLLQRLYVPESGKILIDGIDTALMDPSWLRRQIGVVLQENVLFNRSVRENIAMANPALPFEQVIEAAKLAGAHEFILELPHGYDTILEERGSNLSGGQRQRIAIARALSVDPRILVFDEATSALDYESERIIQANMRAISHGRTVFLIAHRLSTVRDADRIIVMDRGAVAEDGSHRDLVARNGLYSKLVAAAA